MSLDVYLHLPDTRVSAGSGIFVRENGQNVEISREEWDAKFPGREPVIAVQEESDCVFSANITHNLGKMAGEAGVYDVMWRPDENGITHARQLITPLIIGLADLLARPDFFKQFNPDNGWGDYDGLVSFVERYLAACREYPDAEVSAWR